MEISLYDKKPRRNKSELKGNIHMSDAVKLKNIANAFIHIDCGINQIAIDPWIQSGIYDGGWSLFPDTPIEKEILNGITHLYITHLHEDHCDPAALNLLNKNVSVYIPDVFGSYVLQRKLEQCGISKITYLKPGIQTKIN